MTVRAKVSPEVNRLLERLHEDAGFRYALALDPESCLGEFELSETERELLRSRDQDDWFTLIYGVHGPRPELLCIVKAVVKVSVDVSGVEHLYPDSATSAQTA